MIARLLSGAARLGLCVLAAGCAKLPAGWLYVTRVTATGATIVWTGDAPQGVRCAGADGVPHDAIVSRRRSGLRFARVVGLAPATRYTCRLRRDRDGGRRRRVRFHTAPDVSEPFTFAAVGDTGDGGAAAAALARQILADRPAFLLHLGDLAYPRGTPGQLGRRFFGPYQRLLERVPFYPTPGNHDLTSKSGYAEAFSPVPGRADAGRLNYTFDWGGARFFSVSYDGFREGRSDGPQWLAARLAEARHLQWRIVFLHEPAYTSSRKASVRGLRRSLQPVLENGGVDLVLSGHVHLYERAEPACIYVDGARVLAVTSGGGGDAAFDEPGRHPNFARAIAATHYLRVRLSETAIELWAVNEHGQILDHFRNARDSPPRCLARGWKPPRPWMPRATGR